MIIGSRLEPTDFKPRSSKVLLEVGRTVTQNFQLQIGDVAELITVAAGSELIASSTTSSWPRDGSPHGQELPLNGRYFLDLGLLVPGSVTPPQGAFSSAPIRGLGSFGITTAGNREETINYIINGITLNNLTNSSITFQPSIGTVQEFKVDNSTFSAEYGQSSGRSSTLRQDLVAQSFTVRYSSFSAMTSSTLATFYLLLRVNRHRSSGINSAASSAVPLFRINSSSFSYEGLRQRQQLDLNSLVLSDSQRAAVIDPVIMRLVPLIPRSNFVDSSGNPRFVGSASAP